MTQTTHHPGYEILIHRSLTEPLLLAGAPRSIAILIGTLSAAIGLGLQQWIAGITLYTAAQTLAALATKRDPDFLICLLRHLRHHGHLAC